MGKSNAGVAVFQGGGIKNGIYTQRSSRYKFVVTLVPSRHCDSVALFYQDSPNFTVEAKI